jgi:addiction module HigA family antidote
MSFKNTGKRAIKPTHPGEMLREDFMTDYGLTVASLAKALCTTRQTVNELLRERRAVTSAIKTGPSLRKYTGILAQCPAGCRSLGSTKTVFGKDKADHSTSRCISRSSYYNAQLCIDF